MAYRLLISGASGFVGKFIIRHIKKYLPNIKILGIDKIINNKYDTVKADLSNADEIICILKDFSPTHIIHLAGLVQNDSLKNQFESNFFNTDKLYQSILSLQIFPITIQAGSASIYGFIKNEELPINENQPLRPVGAYGLSKASQDMLSEFYYRKNMLPIIRARIFNLAGPEQNKYLVPMTFIDQFHKFKNGQIKTIKTGNLEPTRDFIDVRDVACAFEKLLFKGIPGEAYNIAGETEISIKSIINYLSDITGIVPNIEIVQERVNKFDIKKIYADCSKIKKQTNWKPKIKFKQSLIDMWEYVINRD